MRLTIRRIKLNRDGYDSRGVYWGAGERFFYCPTIDDMGARERAWPHNAIKSACRAPAPRVARQGFFICPECAALPREAP